MWPDYPDDSARKRLRETLARLKKALPDETLLVASGEEVRLERARFSADVVDFLELADEVARPLAQSPAAVPLPEPVYQKMVRAVRLWRTPHFLSGARLPPAPEFEAWVRATETALRSSYLHLLERLVDHDMAAGSLDQAAAWLQIAISADPYNDDMHQRMVSVFERNGWHNDALAYLQQLRERYIKDELPGLPPALEHIETRLREGAALLRDTGQVRWPGRRVAQLPIFGRQSELERLNAVYRRGGVVLLLGEAGSGKTRLVQELFRALEPPPRMMAALARPLENGMPFQPIIDMLRFQITTDEWRALPRLWLSAMQVLLPELAVIFPDLPQAQNSVSLAQPVLFEALHQTLLLLSRSQRLLVFLDDVHWCDETSLNAAAYLVEHGFFGERGALVMACRIEEQPPALKRLTNYLGVSGALLELPLQPLSAVNVAEMARYILDRDLPEGLVARIRQDTGGNPLFLLENLRAMLDFPADALGNSPTDPLPFSSSMHALVQQRLELLSVDARQALTVAAVIGSDFRLDVLEEAANLDRDRLAAALDELERRHLLQPVRSAGAALKYRFIHDRIREIIHLELSPARRRVYHLRVADAFQARPGLVESTSAAVLAQHYEEAGEQRSAFSYWLKAGQHARRLYSVAEARTAFQRAEQLYEQLGALIPEEEVFQLYSSWGEFAFNIASPAVSEHAAQSLLTTGYRRESPLLIAWGYLGLAGADDLRDQADQGLAHLEQARAFIGQLNDPLAWMLYHYRHGGFLIIQNRYAAAIQDLEQALELTFDAYDAEIIEARASIRYRLGLAYLLNGWPAKAHKHSEAVVEGSRSTFNHAGGARGMTGLAIAEYYLGRAAKSIEYGSIAQRMVAPMKNPRLGGMIHSSLALAELSLGHLDAAWQNAQLALESSQDGGFGRIASQALLVQGDIMRILMQVDQAEELYRRGLAESPATYAGMDNLYRLGWLLAYTGRLQEGMDMLDQAIEFCEKSELTLHLLGSLMSKAWALSYAGKNAEAVALANQVAVQTTERELPTIRLSAYILVAQIALTEGRPDEACQKALLVMREARETVQCAPGNERRLGGAECHLEDGPGSAPPASSFERLVG